MKDASTEIGGAGPFLTTRWSLVLGAKESAGKDYRENLEALIRTYWKPVYSYLRRKWGNSNEDAKDLTQSFFADLLGRPFLAGVAPEKGTFRSFLLACLRNFLRDRHDAEIALKRGGGRSIASLDFISGTVVEPEDATTPEDLFARAWEQTVVQEAIARLREACLREKREVDFAVFEAYDLSQDAEASYASVAHKLGISESDVTNRLFQIRRRFRAAVEDVVRDSVSDETQLSEELRSLFGMKE